MEQPDRQQCSQSQDSETNTAKLVLDVLLEHASDIESLRSLLGRMVCMIDEKLSAQLSVIIEASPFAALEGSWRGLAGTVRGAGDDGDVKIKIFDMTWDELAHDLNMTSDQRRSTLYRNIAQRELDTPGGEPFGVVLIDHGLSMDVEAEYDELFTAQLICALGEACVCPFIMGVADDFFGEPDAAWMTDLRRVGSVLQSDDYVGWHRLRSVQNARFLGLVWPQVLVRGRYEDLDIGFRFHQWPSQSGGLWANGGYAFLRTIIAEYRRCAWFGFLKLIGDTPGQGAVLAPDMAPVPQGTTLAGVARIRATRGVGSFLSEEGVIALCESTKTHDLYFVGNRSVADCANDPTAEILTQIQSVLIACRLVHYIKVHIRSLIGQIKSASECELVLNNWLEKYCSNIAEATPDVLAKFPLRDARVSVQETAEGRARYGCDITVRPQYQVDYMASDIRLSTEIDKRQQGAA